MKKDDIRIGTKFGYWTVIEPPDVSRHDYVRCRCICGKEKVVNHHLEVPYHVLQRQYSYDENGQHEEDNGSENMIIHGDNLLALK